MNTLKKLSTRYIGLCVFSIMSTIYFSGPVYAAKDSLSIDQLLKQVKQSRLRDAAENKIRLAEFVAQKAQQVQLIREAKLSIDQLEIQSAELENKFNSNELLVKEKKNQRDERLGSLKDLFGHLTSTAGDLKSRLRNSITTSQFPDRDIFLDQLIKKMNSDTELPTVEEIEGLWFELHREMTESTNVVTYSTQVGTQSDVQVTRAGLFNLFAEGNYLAYDPSTTKVSVLPRQPSKRQASFSESDAQGFAPIGIDPTGAAGGAFLKALINSPTLEERWHQGRTVGYIITGVGVFGLLIALWRFITLGIISISVSRQVKSQEIKTNNPLGRVINVAKLHPNDNVETLEFKIDEAIIRERPNIQRGISLLKIIAAIAPLLGLLGTVTGMIIVFQAITIYGAGDPKAMAGGISSALVTTVLGLIVAIPMLLLHTALNGKARRIFHIIEEQSAGIIADRSRV